MKHTIISAQSCLESAGDSVRYFTLLYSRFEARALTAGS